MHSVKNFFLICLMGLALLSVYQVVTAVNAPGAVDAKIAYANAQIAKQQALIARYQTLIAETDSNDISTLKTYNGYIDKANRQILAQQTLINQLQNGQTRSTAKMASASTVSSVGIQNSSSYNLVLTHVTIFNASCNPACIPMTVLAPNQVQSYSFNASSGYIVFDYDVLDQTKNIGHLAMTASPVGVVLTNGLGGKITQDVQNFQVTYVKPVPYWSGQFSDLKNWYANNWSVSKNLTRWGLSNIEVRASNAGEPSPKGDNYLRIHYPAGSANYRSAPPIGGAQFYGAMINTSQPVTLSFYMKLPVNFPFHSPTRGTTVGKLPGLYGGIGNTGSNVPTGSDGWTTRFMWCDYNKATGQKFVGGGEVLQFTVGSNLGTLGTIDGTFLGCGVWKFLADGKWHNIQQTVHLNTVGQANGQIDVCIDGVPVFTQKNITFRITSSLQTNGIIFQTFFGGGDKSYATPIDTFADFADFALYLYPSTSPAGLCVTNP